MIPSIHANAASSTLFQREQRWLLAAGLLLALHLLMLGYDLHHPDRFLHADRATERIQVIEEFAGLLRDGGSPAAYVDFIAGHGIVGDWLPQAVLYIAGGPVALIVAQVALALLSIVWVRDIGLACGMDAAQARNAALIYGLLPHTLVLPHQLATEAVFVPCVIGSVRWLARARSLPDMGRAGVWLGSASLVRPVILLWPLVCATCMPAPRRARLACLGAAFVPVLLWMCFVGVATGHFSMGESGHDLGHNLYGRAEMVAAALPRAERPKPRADGTHSMTAGEFAAFAVAHPAGMLKHSANDLAVLVAKSGIERLLVDYFDIAPENRDRLQNSAAGWRSRIERQGVVAGLVQVARHSPLLVMGAGAGAVLFLMLMACAVLGVRAWLRAARTATTVRVRRLRMLLILFPLYILATAQAVDAAQSRHRAPAEFALCLLAVAGMRACSAGARGAANPVGGRAIQ